MNKLQLFINDHLMDLADDNPIALTFQINNLAEVKNQQGNTSNQFKLPLTQNNRRVLSFPDDIAFADEQPYKNYRAKLIQDGLEIINYGLAVLNSVDNYFAAVTVLSGNVDFFDSLDVKIYDMGDEATTIGKQKLLTTYDHTWNLPNVVASQTKTEGWIWPVIDYGNMNYSATAINEVDVNHLRPGFFLKTMVEKMVASTGYKAKGRLLDDPLYSKLIVQFSNDSFEHGMAYQNSINNGSAVTTSSMHQQINTDQMKGPNSGIIIFSGAQAAIPGIIKNNRYEAQTPVTLELQLQYGIQVVDITSGGGSEPYINIRIVKYSNNTPTVISNLEHRASKRKRQVNEYFNVKQNIDVTLQPGESVGVEYNLWPGKERVKGILYSGATLTCTNQQTNVVYGQAVQCERIFPDITLRDLLKDTLQRFGIICQADNTKRTVTFASFKDIVDNIPVALDWTTKCLDHGRTISFQLGGYAQANQMRYKEDEAVTPLKFADANIVVKDKTLPPAADLFESQFAPTLNRPYVGGSIAQIKKIDTSNDPASTEFSISTQPRLLIDAKYDLLTVNKKVNFTDGSSTIEVNDTISVPYFYKTDGQHNLCFGDMAGGGFGSSLPGLKTTYYAELEKVLHQTKKVVRYFLLTPIDILNLDFLIPVYLKQDSAYYYINKIESWIKGQPVKVELVKLG